ncbi:MAG: nucleotidyltransferase domain-containing protein [DPANN group archaeon]|nr:nucleotidyltransferase domain-containing protein [DPANN group archaeon]
MTTKTKDKKTTAKPNTEKPKIKKSASPKNAKNTKNTDNSKDKKSSNAEKNNEKKEISKEESQKKRLETAQNFAKEVQKEFKNSLKAVVVYGSTAKGKHKETSDIDTFVIIDDTKLENEIPAEVKEKISADLRRIAAKIDKDITIQAFMFLTEFWESVRSVEPLIMEILRFGIPVYDVGIYMPAKRMLQRGMLPTTNEAVAKRIHIAPQHLKMAEYRIKSGAHFMEQAMAAAGQAPLMLIGKVPPGKEDVPKELIFHFVDKKLLDAKYGEMAQNIHDFAKEIEHAEKKEIKNLGKRTDKYLKMTDEFIKEMQELLKRLTEQKADTVLMNTYKAFLKANVGALELKGVKPPEHLKDLPKTMADHFPDMKELQEDLFERLAKALIIAKKGKAEMIPEREIYGLKEETKRFIYTLGNKLKELKDKGELKITEEKLEILKKLKEAQENNKDHASGHVTMANHSENKKN